MQIRLANYADMDSILEIYAYAREQMKQSGNPTQWGNDRPWIQIIEEDIEKRQAYVVIDQNGICGVFAFIIGEDPTYQVIENGSWLNDSPYGTIHRIAKKGKTKGIFTEVLRFCGAKINNIKIDTHKNNKIMRHILEKNGFKKCGQIYIGDGTPRIAYQKLIG